MCGSRAGTNWGWDMGVGGLLPGTQLNSGWSDLPGWPWTAQQWGVEGDAPKGGVSEPGLSKSNPSMHHQNTSLWQQQQPKHSRSPSSWQSLHPRRPNIFHFIWLYGFGGLFKPSPV